MRKAIITIDGPVGAGKSTISKLLASRLSFTCLDTGALYRAVAYRLKSHGWNGIIGDIDDSFFFTKILLRQEAEGVRVVVDGDDVSDKLRTEEIGLIASRISSLPRIRDMLLPLQRQCAAEGGIVAEGRDMGTVVFPDADVKFFLDASVKERATRRFLEMVGKGENVNIIDITDDLLRRDLQDRGRAIAPLAVPQGAVVVDSTNRSIQEVVDFMVLVVERTCRSEKCFLT